MRNFLITLTPYLIWFFAITETALCVLFFIMIKKNKTHKLLFGLCGALCCGLAFDALVQALGFAFGEGTFLMVLSQMRFIFHGVLIPLLIPIAFYTYGVKNKKLIISLFSITGVIIIFGIAMGFMTKLTFVDFAGVQRYAQDKALTPKFAQIVNLLLSFGGVLPLIGVGVAHAIKHKSPFLLLAGIAMFIFAALGGAIKNPATNEADLNFVITMLGEDLMVFFFGFEITKIKKDERKLAAESLPEGEGAAAEETGARNNDSAVVAEDIKSQDNGKSEPLDDRIEPLENGEAASAQDGEPKEDEI